MVAELQTTDTYLSDKHYQELRYGSGIPDDAIQAAGFYTETDSQALEALGFAYYQAITPALVLPIRTPDGQTFYAIKPDKPRLNAEGKPLKYEYPAGGSNHLHVPVTCRDAVMNGSDRILIGEGYKKVEATAAAGYPCVAVLGVWNWLEKADNGNSLPLSELFEILVKGRTIGLVPDSDAKRNDSVRLAFERLYHFFKALGAKPYMIDLPDLPNGSKAGLDDYLLANPGANPWDLARDPEAEAKRESRMYKTAAERADRLERELTEERQKNEAIMGVLSTGNYEPAARPVIVTVLTECDRQRRMGRAKPSGKCQISVERIAEATGMSRKAAGRHIQAISDSGLWERTEGDKTEANGHIYRPVYVKPLVEGTLTGQLFAAAKHFRDLRKVNSKRKYQPRRCRVCQSENITLQTVAICNRCGHMEPIGERHMHAVDHDASDTEPVRLVRRDVPQVQASNGSQDNNTSGPLVRRDVPLNVTSIVRRDVPLEPRPQVVPPPTPGMQELEDLSGNIPVWSEPASEPEPEPEPLSGHPLDMLHTYEVSQLNNLWLAAQQQGDRVAAAMIRAEHQRRQEAV